jgi:translation initiation factor 2 alpha subunit (eIF-2alpha)
LSHAQINAKWIEDWNEFGDDFEELSKEIADKIKETCKNELNIPRYKLIVQVTIGQRKDQGVKIVSRCLWDTATDQYASFSYQNEHVWLSAMVFGIYTD